MGDEFDLPPPAMPDALYQVEELLGWGSHSNIYSVAHPNHKTLGVLKVCMAQCAGMGPHLQTHHARPSAMSVLASCSCLYAPGACRRTRFANCLVII